MVDELTRFGPGLAAALADSRGAGLIARLLLHAAPPHLEMDGPLRVCRSQSATDGRS